MSGKSLKAMQWQWKLPCRTSGNDIQRLHLTCLLSDFPPDHLPSLTRRMIYELWPTLFGRTHNWTDSPRGVATWITNNCNCCVFYEARRSHLWAFHQPLTTQNKNHFLFRNKVLNDDLNSYTYFEKASFRLDWRGIGDHSSNCYRA